MTHTDADILAANENTKWDVLVIASEITHRGEHTRTLASAAVGPRDGQSIAAALIFARCQAEFSGDDATIYQRTASGGWRKRAR